MIEIPVLGGFKIAGFDHIVQSDLETDQALHSKNVWGDYSPWERRIRILSFQQPQEWSNSFIHEVMEAVRCLYLAGELSHEVLTSVTNGLHQVFEELNIRFVPRYSEPELRSQEVKSC